MIYQQVLIDLNAIEYVTLLTISVNIKLRPMAHELEPKLQTNCTRQKRAVNLKTDKIRVLLGMFLKVANVSSVHSGRFQSTSVGYTSATSSRAVPQSKEGRYFYFLFFSAAVYTITERLPLD